MSLPSTNDILTGLLTRAAFEDEFKAFMSSAAETGQPISLAFLDIDNFLKINETQGHEGGDKVLMAVAEILSKQASEDAIAARYGGDEFALLFPYLEREQTFLILERIRAEIDGMADFQGVVTQATISGGVASFPVDGNSENEIIRKADQALFRAKKTGRNSIRLAYEEKMAPKTSHFTLTQLERLSILAKDEGLGEAVLIREALDDLLLKYRVNEIES